ncbi:facilitated trehalose transporter Tret1-like [Epargyreus clarus]|uniref:facilitated trehalose transporter Tret1-like n=1 Tax=Epargyreus clarus TaxID=520877 RepID=UPI003C2DDA3C
MSQCFTFSPFTKQCFVTLGVILNTMEQAVINGFSSVLVPQLRESKYIELDEEAESWIASIQSLSLLIGALIVPSIMGIYGRKVANCLSAAILCLSWFGMTVCTDFYSLLFIKLIQGLCAGMIAIFASVTVGEYTSPKYRGAFLATISCSYSIGMLLVHGLGTVLSWQNVARVFGAITFLDCVIILYSPETPSFLVAKGRFDECRKVFHWLRYKDEEAEVEKLIKKTKDRTLQEIEEKFRGKQVTEKVTEPSDMCSTPLNLDVEHNRNEK